VNPTLENLSPGWPRGLQRERRPSRARAAAQALYLKGRALLGMVVSEATRTLFRHTPLDFDHRHGVDTRGSAGLRALSTPVHDARGCSRYEPVSVKHFRYAMALLPRPLEQWSFLDIGSGKGRAVLLALGYPFREVGGVELDPVLCAQAEDNLLRYRGPRRSPRVNLRCADATHVPLPPADVVLYFYNALGGRLLARFLDHLEATLRERPRRLLLIYSNPVERAQVDARAAFTPLFEGDSPYDFIAWGCRRLVIYGAGPGTAAGALRA
jgi:SAM-dependent methyltransferase